MIEEDPGTGLLQCAADIIFVSDRGSAGGDNQIMIAGKFAQLRADHIFLVCHVVRLRDMTAFLLQQRTEYRKVGIINLARRERKTW